MITPSRMFPELTPRQCEYLQALRDGRKTGKQMRARLRRRGIRGSNCVFYRSIQRLKNRGLIKTERPKKGSWKYRPQERFYKLTAAGSAVVGPRLELVNGGESRSVGQDFRAQIERARACLG